MSNYGRNFEFLQSPLPQHRLGRYVTKATGAQIPLGAPVRVPAGAVANAEGRLPLELATGATEPEVGRHGILIHEYAFNAFRGFDPVQTVISDFDKAPLNAPSQLCYGDEVKVRLINTVDRNFQGQKAYAGRVMIPGLGATPTVAEGDYLTPGTGNDDDGYWAVTADKAEAWLYVTLVDSTFVEAQMLF